MRRKPRVLGIDDAPFEKGQEAPVPIVGVVMAGSIVEGVAIGSFPVDGEDATRWMAGWIDGLRWRDSLQGIVLGGITIAGLGLVDLEELAGRVGAPVLAVTRRSGRPELLARALEVAGLSHRTALLDRQPPARLTGGGLWCAHAGATAAEADALLEAIVDTKMPEPLRIAHLVGAALVLGQSRGRV
jgi:endonuclease V-like protein UPF0215 family